MVVIITLHIREIRKAKGLTLEELSRLSGVSKSHISEIEREMQMPTLNILCLLAGALDVKAEELYIYRVKK